MSVERPGSKQAASVQEARAYMNFDPCGCGSRVRHREAVAFEVGGGSPRMRLSFACGGCGEAREFTFDAGLFYPDSGPVGAAFSSSEAPSRLLDPIQYCHIALHHARQIPVDLGALDHGASLEVAREHAVWALAACCEALKFFGAESLSPDPSWGSESLTLFETNPERYARACVLEQQKALCDVLDTIDALHQFSLPSLV